MLSYLLSFQKLITDKLIEYRFGQRQSDVDQVEITLFTPGALQQHRLSLIA
jgi:hypothetical protein